MRWGALLRAAREEALGGGAAEFELLRGVSEFEEEAAAVGGPGMDEVAADERGAVVLGEGMAGGEFHPVGESAVVGVAALGLLTLMARGGWGGSREGVRKG